MSRVLIDVGNTRLKWQLTSGSGATVRQGVFRYSYTDLDQQLDEGLIPASFKPELVVAVSVARANIKEKLARWVTYRWALECRFLEVTHQYAGLTCGYQDPSQFGVDRWYALIGGMALQKPPFCVCDLGSAITVDFVDQRGQHQGGLIAPGLRLMLQTLSTNTALPRLDTHSLITSQQWGKDTRSGIQNGTFMAIAGLINDSFMTLISENESAALLLTGGDAALIAPLIRHPYKLYPDLVLQGVAALIDGDLL